MEKLLVICLTLVAHIIGNLAISDEKRLTKHLLDNYERVGTVGRPVSNTTDTVDIKLGLSLLKIVDLDQVEHTFSSVVWIAANWNDILMKWNPKDFGGVPSIVVPANRIWTPDITILNALEPKTITLEPQARVTSEGEVTWIQPMSIHVLCDPERSGSDQEKPSCDVTLGSRMLSTEKISLSSQLDRVDSSHLMSSHLWEVYKTKAVAGEKSWPWAAGETFPEITYTIQLRRIPQEDDGSDDEAQGAGNILVTSCVLVVMLPSLALWYT